MKFYLDKNGKINASLSDILPDGVKEVSFEDKITPSDYNNDIDAGGNKYIIVKNVVKLRPLTPEEIKQKRINEIDQEISEIEAGFENFKQTPIQYPLNNKLYKPIWADDGTYIKIIVAMQVAQQLGIESPTQLIWDTTGKEENAVIMTLNDVIQLTSWLRTVAEPVYLEQKRAKSILEIEKERLLKE